MKCSVFLLWLVLALCGCSMAMGEPIEIRLSYKAVLNPIDGRRANNFTDAQIDQAIASMNRLMASYARGYRFVRHDVVVDIGVRFDTEGPSRWYSTDFFDDSNGVGWRNEMEAAAKLNSGYRWDPTTINIYVTDGICGGICSFPGENIIIVGGCAAADGPLQLHEIGHYFDLCHTHGCSCGGCDGSKTGVCHTQPGDDEIVDTLPDLHCWGRDDIANWSFGTVYSSVNPSQQDRVDDVFFNIMSYHANKSRLTDDQLDKWTDAANERRRHVMNGSTVWVDHNSSCPSPNDLIEPFRTLANALTDIPDGARECKSYVLTPGFPNQPLTVSLGGPYKNFSAGLNAAANGDVVLIRAGRYNEPQTINRPVTLAATRGDVVIGAP